MSELLRQKVPYIAQIAHFLSVGAEVRDLTLFDSSATVPNVYSYFQGTGKNNYEYTFDAIGISTNFQFVGSNAILKPTAPADAAAAYADNLILNEADDLALRQLQRFYELSTIVVSVGNTEQMRFPLVYATGMQFINNGRNLSIVKADEKRLLSLKTQLKVGKEHNPVTVSLKAAPGLTLANGGQVHYPGSGLAAVTVGGANIPAEYGYSLILNLAGEEDRVLTV